MSFSSKPRWGFRIAAVALAIIPFILAEGLFAILGWGKPDYSEDPFIGFKKVTPLFELNEAGDAYTIQNTTKLDWFYPESFPSNKNINTFRVFCVGGSTVAGRPYTAETAFSSWLEIYLNHNDPDRKWDVVNCGGVSYASYRLVPIVEEIVENYQPDLIVLYTGHNEFLEDRSYEHIKNLPDAVVRPYELASKLRTFNVMRKAYAKSTGKGGPSAMETRPILPEEVDALLEHKGGMEIYHRDPDWNASVLQHFRYNLEAMLASTASAQVPLILMNPSCNLAHTPPFKSEHGANLGDHDKNEFIDLMNSASKAFRQGELDRAMELYEAAIKIDPLFAEAHYQLGRTHDYARDYKQAYKHYIDAKDLDVCPLRMLEPMHDILKEVATSEVGWIDTREEVNAIVPVSGIPGENEFLDHVHPNVGGHQFFAKLVIEEMANMALVTLRDGWLVEGGPPITPETPEEQAEELMTTFQAKWDKSVGPSIETYLTALPETYWEAGQERLLNVRNWARGLSQAEEPVQPRRKNTAP